ncbi:hypothetical protein ACWDZ4_22095 [Streptomyces sp. NPDC003016]
MDVKVLDFAAASAKFSGKEFRKTACTVPASCSLAYSELLRPTPPEVGVRPKEASEVQRYVPHLKAVVCRVGEPGPPDSSECVFRLCVVGAVPLFAGTLGSAR